MSYYNSGNHLQRTTPIVLNLIIINVLVFAAQNMISPSQFDVDQWGSTIILSRLILNPTN